MPRPKPRRRVPWAAYLWPGLPHLWVRGSLAGLLLALAFSVLLNVLILATLVWPAWLPPRLRLACAATALGLWIAALWETRGELRRLAQERESAEAPEQAPAEDPNNALLREAQRGYLRGDLRSAETALRKAVRQDRDDFEAKFWLVSVARKGGRIRRAERLLARIERLDAAAAWRHELADEQRRIDEAKSATQQPTDQTETTVPDTADTASVTPIRRAA